jgi:tripartite-type tricarboxylate transporter receptor subunit TctC
VGGEPRYNKTIVNKVLLLILAALGAAVTLGVSPALAQPYPAKPIRVIVPSPPGGGTDVTTRMLTPKLSEILGQQLVVDNRGGAAGNIGAEAVARAAPDGYTLLAGIASLTSNPYVMKKVPYDIDRDFYPISRTVVVPSLLMVHTSLPAKNVRELIAFVRARPGQLQYASAGVGSAPHLMMALLSSMGKLEMIHVPYKGAGPALVDLIAGHVPMFAGNIVSSLPHVKAGRVRALGVTSAKRSSAAPEVPVIADALPGYEAVTWFGLLAPAGTPREIVAKLHAGVVQALEDNAVKQRFVADGAEPLPSASPEDFREFMRAESRKWGKVVKDAKIQPE